MGAAAPSCPAAAPRFRQLMTQCNIAMSPKRAAKIRSWRALVCAGTFPGGSHKIEHMQGSPRPWNLNPSSHGLKQLPRSEDANKAVTV